MSYYTLLTGATGLVGRFLTRDLLEKDRRLAVLVRSTDRTAAAERMESVLQYWETQSGRHLPRPVCLEGDVAQPGLGLSAPATRWLARYCDRVIHNAAVLVFDGPDPHGDPWHTNVEGTRHVLDLCRALGLTDFHYVSTAYVCGTRQGVIREDELEMDQDFRNDYEKSKYLAEQLVRNAEFINPPTIYRPVVIGGDWRTGYTNTYHGIYVYLRLISILLNNIEPGPDGRRYTPARLALHGDEKRNLVPVDWISKVICDLLDTPAAHGRTFHLAPQVPVTTRAIIEAAYSYFNSYGVDFCGPEWAGSPEQTISEQAYRVHGDIYRAYERTDPTFDTSNLLKFAGHLPCPVIDEAVLHRYWQYGEHDRWGKHTHPKIQIPVWAEDVLNQTMAMMDASSVTNLIRKAALSSASIGLDVIGPGGGQWHIRYTGQGRPVIDPGLPPNGAPVFRLTADRLARITGTNGYAHALRFQPGSECPLQSNQIRRSQRIARSVVSYLARDGFAIRNNQAKRLAAPNTQPTHSRY